MECTHCGKTVKPTIHRREGEPPYEVGYYILLTGQLERVTMKSQSLKEDVEIEEFYSLHEPRWVVTCSECFSSEEIRDRLESMFRDLPSETAADGG